MIRGNKEMRVIIEVITPAIGGSAALDERETDALHQ